MPEKSESVKTIAEGAAEKLNVSLPSLPARVDLAALNAATEEKLNVAMGFLVLFYPAGCTGLPCCLIVFGF